MQPANAACGCGRRVSATLLRRLAFLAFVVTVALLLATDLLAIAIAHELGESFVLNDGELGVLPFSVVLVTFPVVGLLITRRQPSNAIGWLLIADGFCWAVWFWFDGYLRWTLEVRPGSLPGAGYVGALTFPLWVPMVGLMGTFLILLFPDGHLPSPRWRLVSRASVLTISGLYLLTVVRPGPVGQASVDDPPNPFAVDALMPVRPALDALTLLLPLCIVACAGGLVMRFRRSRGIERLQLKWLASAGAFVAFGYLIIMVAGAYTALTDAGPAPQWFDVAASTFLLSFALIPAAIGVAVLKHGLYGIDRLISRTVSYALLTGTLLVVYVGVVTAVSSLTPKDSSFAVAASTLAVAALFQPLRRRLQVRVDRRFNRARYDADRTVDAFTRRLRDEVDLDAVRADLLQVVQGTLQPASAGLWLRDRAR